MVIPSLPNVVKHRHKNQNNQLKTTLILLISVYYYLGVTLCNNVLLISLMFTNESSIGCSDNIEHTRKSLFLANY